MEHNGFKIKEEILHEQLSKLRGEREEIVRSLIKTGGCSFIPDSPIKLSCYLFGGTYPVDTRAYFYRDYKSGRKLVSRRERIDKRFRGLGFEPRTGTETARKGIYSTDKDQISTLRCRTKAQKEVKTLLLRLSEVKKQISMIAPDNGKGLPYWTDEEGFLRPQILNTSTITTRKSCVRPNLQNVPREGTAPVKLAFISRF
jgi:DNA polymerase I-like protein with 3'-5' exonuclease and polymerase domains